MENRSTTMYTPAKKRMGCNAPIVLVVLDLIRIEFLFLQGLGSIKIVKKPNDPTFYNAHLVFKLRYFHAFKLSLLKY